jgi:hypothetical protein
VGQQRHTLIVTDLEAEVSFWTRAMGMSVLPCADSAGRGSLSVSFGERSARHTLILREQARGGGLDYPRACLDARIPLRPGFLSDVARLGGRVLGGAGGRRAADEVALLSPSGHLVRAQLVRSSVTLSPILHGVRRAVSD